MSTEILFEEKQYLGYNKQSMMRRTLLALFCFLAYYWSENPRPVNVSGVHIGSYPAVGIENSGNLFFIMGVTILLFSIFFTYLVHLHVIVKKEGISLTGLWTARKVQIHFRDIVSARKMRYSSHSVGRSVYNLHSNGKVRFYTRGNELVELTDRSGLKYRIGSQRASELLELIKSQI
jgi:hypothetical protein